LRYGSAKGVGQENVGYFGEFAMVSRLSFLLATLLVALSVLPRDLPGQGFLLHEDHDHRYRLPRHHWPHPPVRPPEPQPITWHIKALSIDSKIEDQVAITQVSQTFRNTGSRQIEASFVFPLPHDGAVDKMTFLVDGKEYEATLLDAQKAREIYEGYIRRNQDPALLEWLGQGMFKTSVFPIPPGAERTVQIRYTQLIRQDTGVNDLLVPLSAARFTDKPVEKFSLRAAITTTAKLKNIYSPTHQVQIDRSGDNSAVVKLEADNVVPTTDFRLMYSSDDRSVGASLLSYWPEGDDSGYFTLLASPEIKPADGPVPPKCVIFVVDRSGSMSGDKIEQARGAARFVLSNLRENDLFNIIAYDSNVETFRPELQRFTPQALNEANAYVDGLFAGGSTNIDGALQTALGMVQDKSIATWIVFLTDGLPTTGEQNELRIAANSKKANKNEARVISFGVGYDVNSRLLDRLSRENRGQSQYVRPDENLEEHVARLYAKLAAPVMTDIQIDYVFEGAAVAENLVNRVYPAGKLDLFAGQQLVLCGRYRGKGPAKIRMSGKVGEEPRVVEFDVRFAEPSKSSQYSFTARLWATRRIGEILDVIDLEGKNQELIDELVRLSTSHGILTPYTSWIADDQGGADQFTRRESNNAMTGENLSRLEESEGQSGFAQRGFKQGLIAGAAPAGEALDKGGGGGGTIADEVMSLGLDKPGQRPVGEVVRNSGKDNAYLRGKYLIASNALDIDPEKDKDKINNLQRYTDEYFELLKSTTVEENQLLALQGADEELLVRIQGKVYLIR
jgi:Ca-activated chloride channel homolog